MEKLKSGANKVQRELIATELDHLVIELSKKLDLSPEGVVLEFRYWHQRASNPYRTHATATDKKESYLHHGGACSACKIKIPLSECVFHHTQRGIAEQHSPKYLIPLCDDCHNKEHGVTKNSLTKGSR